MSVEVQNELSLLRELVATLKSENTLLRQKIDLLIRKLFGASSEQINPAQLELLLQLAGASAPAPEKPAAIKAAKPTPTPRGPSEPRLPENLPVVEEVLDPEPVKAAPAQWRFIGQEVTEQLDYEPGRFLRRRIIRRKYVHRTEVDAVPVIAPLPECLLERGIAAPGLLAQVIVGKYCDHLPLYRQEEIYLRRHRVHLPRQTLARWMELSADWLKPIYQHIRTGVMAGGYVQVDETPIEYLEPGHGKTRQGYLWTCARPGSDVIFHWETSRAASCLEALIPAEFKGTLQCDGYSAYPAFAQTRTGIVLAGCWAHARRGFHQSLEHAPKVAGWFLRQIQNLYQVEAWLRERRAGPELRLALRASQSHPIVQRIYQGLIRLKKSNRFLPKSTLGQAIDYALNQWSGLIVFLNDGRVEIDNNLVENAIRPTAIGKKNWLFVGQAQAGERSAILYTLVECCRRRGLNPYAYLRDVLSRLPKMTNWQVNEVTPEAWAKAQKPLSTIPAS